MAANEDSDIDFQLNSDSDDELPNAQVTDAAHVARYGNARKSTSDDDITPQRHSYLTKDRGIVSQDRNPGSGISSSNKATAGRIIPSLKHNPCAAESTYFTRPNRYFGPASTWRSWTAEDRLVAQSLDRVRAGDLSVHLFNTFALKQRGRRALEERRKSRRRGKGKERASSAGGMADRTSDEDEIEANAFIPPRIWTAWPMPPDDVPRDDPQHYRDLVAMPRKPLDISPSAMLEENFISTTLRLAREQWRARSWESDESEEEKMKTEIEDVQMHGESGSEGNEESAADEDTSDESDAPPVHTSQAFYSPSSENDNEGRSLNLEGEEKEIEEDDRPTPLADDEKARNVLLPSTKHIFSKLDDLLLGLHKSRQVYAVRKPKKMSESNDEETGADTDTSTGRSRIRGRSKSANSNKKRKRAASVASVGSEHSKASSTSTREGTKSKTLGLRDWSDVIGMAALTGWDHAVVQRAAERCARMFGQDMMFRTFYEGHRQGKEKAYFKEKFALDRESSSEGEEGEHIGTEGHDKLRLIRISEACERCRRLNAKCEPADEKPGRRPCKRCLDANKICLGITSKLGSRRSRFCPYQNCERHAIPFTDTYHLQRHIDAIHRDERSPTRPTSSEAEAPSMGIVCPVMDCPRYARGFSRGSKLYEHVRKMHPEINVADIKRLESEKRRERRGKRTDERRRPDSRSVSRARSRRRSSPVASESEENQD